MKKQLILFFLSTTGNIISYAQNHYIGIGTSTPKSYLHINEPGRTSGIGSGLTKGLSITGAGNTTMGGPGIYWENVSLPVGQKLMQLNYGLNANHEGFINFQSVTDNAASSTTDGTIMSITHNGKVGIHTHAPAATLDVAGNMILQKAIPSAGGDVSALVRDNVTGEIKVARTKTNSHPLNYIEYTLSNVLGDWVADYDTRIDTAQYVLAIVGSSFNNPEGAAVLISNNAPPNPPVYNPINVYAFRNRGTWHLSADYRDGGTFKGFALDGDIARYNGTWIIRCLVINKAIIKMLNGVSQNLGTSNTGSAPTPPSGL